MSATAKPINALETSLLTVVGLLLSDEELVGFAASVSDVLESPEDAMETIVEHMLASPAGWRHGALFLDRALPYPIADWMALPAGELLHRATHRSTIIERAGLTWLLLRERLRVLEPIASKLARQVQNRLLRGATRHNSNPRRALLATNPGMQVAH